MFSSDTYLLRALVISIRSSLETPISFFDSDDSRRTILLGASIFRSVAKD